MSSDRGGGGKEYAAAAGGGRRFPVSSQQRRGHSSSSSLSSAADNLDLFSTNRRSFSLPSSDESDVSSKLGRISVGSEKVARSGVQDLLASTDAGKHDYDWLLTPPETPLFPSDPPSRGHEFQSDVAVERSSIVVKSASTVKPSRQSASHSEIRSSYRPVRSSSVTRSSFSHTQNGSYSSPRSSSILNTSSASVSSYIRPSSPVTRSSSAARPSTLTARTTASQSSTPSKSRSGPTLSSADKPRPSQSSRPSTPSSRPQLSGNICSQASLSSSRPSTPTRRAMPVTSTASNLLASSACVQSSGRAQNSASRSSSPGPHVRPQLPVIPSDFPLETPPNLRTTLPDRPVSAGRSRPGASVTAKANSENHGSVALPRRSSSPIITRSRSVEPNGRGHLNVNSHTVDFSELKKVANPPESPVRKTVKASAGSENGGFGRSISKKSLDMAIRHMDIRNGPGSMRLVPGTIRYPQSIRTTALKAQPVNALIPETSLDINGSASVCSNGYIPGNGKHANGSLENGKREEKGRSFGRVDIFESSRYDTMLLKEDLKNTSWLHSLDGDKSDQGLIFDNGFEHLPEPFSLS
ncbi:hypothetical protein Droror1_Dr00013750 [Drosera rotundifolia]